MRIVVGCFGPEDGCEGGSLEGASRGASAVFAYRDDLLRRRVRREYV
jgi:hypothetical protein